eukprot:SAG11_NODE_22087_length_412_cov_1.472843_1_plen_82_part_01
MHGFLKICGTFKKTAWHVLRYGLCYTAILFKIPPTWYVLWYGLCDFAELFKILHIWYVLRYDLCISTVFFKILPYHGTAYVF